MTGAMTERGTALMATLILIMILLPLGAYVVQQCRTDLMIERNFRAEIEAFYTAEAGLEHALAEIDPGQSFDDVLAGPDRIAGTADDGTFPFREGPPAAFPSPPLGYDVRVTLAGANVLSIASRGIGRYAATKVVAALVTRSRLVFTPAALYAQSDIRQLDLGGGQLLLSGLDHRIDDPPGNPTGAAAPIPALASPDADAEQDLRRRLPEGLAGRLPGAGAAPSIATSPTVNVQTYADRFATLPDCRHLPTLNTNIDENTDDTWGLGTPETPQMSVVEGDANISGSLRGNGVLVVRGTLHITGTLEFTGLVIALNGILFEPTGNVKIAGALWQGLTIDNRLQLGSSGAIVYSSCALAAADTAFPGVLPHAAVVSGWQEEL
jgi:hypothetical protein